MADKKKGGRPKILYDPELAKQVQSMAQYGLPQEKIGIIVGLSLLTLRKLYAKELETGNALANLAVGKKLFERCIAGDTACLIFYAKCQLGWRETDKKDSSQSDDAAKQLTAAIKAAMNSVGN